MSLIGNEVDEQNFYRQLFSIRRFSLQFAISFVALVAIGLSIAILIWPKPVKRFETDGIILEPEVGVPFVILWICDLEEGTPLGGVGVFGEHRPMMYISDRGSIRLTGRIVDRLPIPTNNGALYILGVDGRLHETKVAIQDVIDNRDDPTVWMDTIKTQIDLHNFDQPDEEKEEKKHIKGG